MTENTPPKPRVAPMYYNAKGIPSHYWTMTPSSITDPVLCFLPPDGVLPVIFVPGIMGSNLRSLSSSAKEGEGKPVWRLDAGLGGKNIWLAKNWFRAEPAKRQKALHPDRVEVDNKGAVPKHPVGSILPFPGRSGTTLEEACIKRYQERGWGEVSETSYHGFLLWLEEALNTHFLPHQWPQFQTAPEHLSLNAYSVLELNLGITIPMPGLGDTLQQEMEPVLSDELIARAEYRMPVHACGYNWLASNKDAAQQLAERIDQLMQQYGRNCQQVILVTHSMGGLVARRCAQLPGMAGKIAGVVHGVMPALGAPVAYRRCKVGMLDEDPIAGAVIGATGKEVTAVFAQAPGALQLLPNQSYASGWLRLLDENGASAMPSQPADDPYDEIYLRRDRWWGLLREEWLAPKGGEPVPWETFVKNIKKGKHFHKEISRFYHPQTYVYYGDDTRHPSFETITWKMKPGRRLPGPHGPHGTAPDAFAVSMLEMNQVRDDGRSPVYVGGARRVIRPPQETFQQVETSYWELHCAMQDGIGDGTVPVSSGNAPGRLFNNAPIRQQIGAAGFDHEASYGHPLAQHFTLYSLVKIAAQARKPLCTN